MTLSLYILQDTSGRDVSYENIAVNKTPTVEEVGVGSTVLFHQARYGGRLQLLFTYASLTIYLRLKILTLYLRFIYDSLTLHSAFKVQP